MKGENCFNYQVYAGVLHYLSDGVSDSPLSKQFSFKISGGTEFRWRDTCFRRGDRPSRRWWDYDVRVQEYLSHF